MWFLEIIESTSLSENHLATKRSKKKEKGGEAEVIETDKSAKESQ